MFVDLINIQKKQNRHINPEIAVCGGAPASQHLYEQIKDILKVKTIKVWDFFINKRLLLKHVTLVDVWNDRNIRCLFSIKI